MNKQKKILIIAGLILLFLISILLYNKFYSTGEIVKKSSVQITPLSAEQRNKVIQTIMSSKFIEDIPEEYPIALRFFNFENGQRVWREGFLIGKNGLLSQGNPGIYLTLHSKYISELNTGNLCEIIKKANQNGDLGFNSEYNKASLLWKYKNILPHGDCFGV